MKEYNVNGEEELIKTAKLNLVDLAGMSLFCGGIFLNNWSMRCTLYVNCDSLIQWMVYCLMLVRIRNLI